MEAIAELDGSITFVPLATFRSQSFKRWFLRAGFVDVSSPSIDMTPISGRRMEVVAGIDGSIISVSHPNIHSTSSERRFSWATFADLGMQSGFGRDVTGPPRNLRLVYRRKRDTTL